MKIPEQRQWRRSGIFIVKFEYISHLVLVFILLTLNMQLPARLVKGQMRWMNWIITESCNLIILIFTLNEKFYHTLLLKEIEPS